MRRSRLTLLICCSLYLPNYCQSFGQWPPIFSSSNLLPISFSSFVSSIPFLGTSSSVIFVARSVGDSFAQRHHQHTLILSHSLLCAFISVVLSFPLRLCSPCCFLCLYFHCCQSLLLRAFVTAHPSRQIFPPSCRAVLILLWIAGDSLCKCACLTFLLCPVYVTQTAESAVSVSNTDN